jgi:hypothetical protein
MASTKCLAGKMNALSIKFLFTFSAVSLASYECETPESSYEKERHKSLK